MGFVGFINIPEGSLGGLDLSSHLDHVPNVFDERRMKVFIDEGGGFILRLCR